MKTNFRICFCLLIALALAQRDASAQNAVTPATQDGIATGYANSELPSWLHLDGEEVHCTRTEFRLLCELAASPNKVLSREQLLDRVWGYDYFGDGRLVDVHIRRLRTKVEPDPTLPRHILTVRGMGVRSKVRGISAHSISSLYASGW